MLSAASVRAASSVLSSWLQGRAKRKVTLKSGDDEIVSDGPLTRAQQELVTALAERRRRLERAVLAVRLAAEDGVVLGGGVALAGAADVLDASNPAHAALAGPLREPQRPIALKVGFNPSVAAEPVFDAVGVLSTAGSASPCRRRSGSCCSVSRDRRSGSAAGSGRWP